jgi:hypothetical protein
MKLENGFDSGMLSSKNNFLSPGGIFPAVISSKQH